MQRGIVKFTQALAGQDDDVQMVQISAMVSEGLPGYAFDPVSVYGPPDIFLGNDQPQPCMCLVVVPGQQQKGGT
ncbi:hypothetical protein GCM10009083_20260 [Halopseudomonas pertucinogena]|uniref:Uncharacterized protein n=1 Tax=Halopseudomonas pertucinogena TaxID=86175 RepID=A0ABQ2CR58_9GAMM|nr:hypothetical protein GCM10009083_20260 [Halopseudomonas pertucinogena]